MLDIFSSVKVRSGWSGIYRWGSEKTESEHVNHVENVNIMLKLP